LLFDVLPLARSGAFGDGFAEEGHELAHAGAREAGVGAQIAFRAEFDRRLLLVLQYLEEVG
jgi:hypothetical protein